MIFLQLILELQPRIADSVEQEVTRPGKNFEIALKLFASFEFKIDAR